MADSVLCLDTARIVGGHPRAKTITSVRGCSVDRQRVFAVRIAGVHADAGWTWRHLGDLLDMTPQDAKRLCEYGKATAEQLALVLARAPRRAA